MNMTVRNVFGVAAAIIILLGLNLATDTALKTSSETTEVKKEATKPPQANSLRDFNEAIIEIAEKTNPAVVTITTKRTQEVRTINPFSQFFGMPDQREDGNTREYVRRGLGSGVIVSDEGYILTNNHVIEDTDEIRVRLYNGNEVNAELVGTDPETDIAVLQIDIESISTVKMGNSDGLKVGSFVLAIGSPLSENLAHTVSFGIVSARGRSLNRLTPYGDYIQTDAAINPGNSGGALIDINGELVGINSAIASRSGGNDGIGFAIPINLAKRIMDDLIEDGEVSRGYLGMYLGAEVDQTMAKALGLDDIRGIIVGKVEENSPASEAGLQEQDVIVALNDEEIRNWDSFRTSITSFKPGDKIDLEIIRDNENITLHVTLGKREADGVASSDLGNTKDLDEKLGFKVRELNSDIRRQLNIKNDIDGFIVLEVKESSNAYERGLRSSDIITEIDKKKIDSLSDFYKQLENKEGEVVLLTIIRNDLKQYVAFEL